MRGLLLPLLPRLQLRPQDTQPVPRPRHVQPDEDHRGRGCDSQPAAGARHLPGPQALGLQSAGAAHQQGRDQQRSQRSTNRALLDAFL